MLLTAPSIAGYCAPIRRTTTTSAIPIYRISSTFGCVSHFGLYGRTSSHDARTKEGRTSGKSISAQRKRRCAQILRGGIHDVLARARKRASTDFPITVFYAFKQSDNTVDGTVSSGWETLLEGMVQSRWMITGTWPMRSERGGRTRAIDSNTLASSIVLALRPRSEGAPTADRRGFISALQAELPGRLRELQHGAIAPVDLPQAAIGPGMAVFSRYAKVIESDGSAMGVRSALARINEVLDEVLSEQEGDFDATTRFAISWYRQHGYDAGAFGAADNMARARNTSVAAMERAGILTGRAGKVALLSPPAYLETMTRSPTWTSAPGKCYTI